MIDGAVIETERLILRRWRPEDLAPFAALNADAEVMAHFPAPHTREQSDGLVAMIDDHFDRHGFGWWAVERRSDGALLGMTGLSTLRPESPLHPGVEIGWRFARHAWGQGHASEAARASLAFGFQRLSLAEIVSFTATTNAASEAVMRRIGLERRAVDDFDHPAIVEGHRLSRHVVYGLSAEAWRHALRFPPA